MKRRFLLTFGGLLLLVLLIDAAAAQNARFDVSFEHERILLTDSGRVDIPLVVTGEIENTACAGPQTYTVKLQLDPFARWAGASLLPPEVTFTAQGAYLAPQRLPPQTTVLNVAWDLDSAPRQAEQMYTVRVSPDDVVESGGPCLPDPVIRSGDPARTTVVAPEAPPPIVVDCETDPFQPNCVTSSAPPTDPSIPFPGLGSLLVALLVAITAWRRTRRA